MQAFGVCLFMVEEGASVAVGAPTQVTPAAGIRSYSMPGITLYPRSLDTTLNSLLASLNDYLSFNKYLFFPFKAFEVSK